MRLFFIAVLTVCTFSQEAQFNVLLTGSYSTLPFQIRKENSGIYGIASFVPNTDGMLFCSYDAPDVYFVNRTGLIRQNDMRANAFGSVLNADVIHEEEAIEGVQKQCFHTSACDFFEKDGVLINAKNEKIALRLTGSQSFNLTIHSEGIITEKQFTTGRNIAAVDIAGIDEAGHLFIIAEYYKSEVPLAIERELRVYNINGELTATLAIPMIKGLTLIKEFSVDSSGNFYHLLTGKESYSLIRWSGLAECKGSHYSYPALFNYELHYNNEVPVSEPETGTPENVTASASRSFALRLGESYELYKYNCSTANLVPQAVRAPDGDTVKTPPRLIVGANAKVPYKWGGFNTLAQISTGLLQGKYAGDIHTAGVSSSSVGVDCSGFLSRCWQLSSHVSTSGMPSITTLYTAWDSLKPGDAVHRVGHVRMFIEKCPNGSLKVVESSGRDWGVSYWSYLPSDLVTYAPRFYNNMETVYARKRPVLQSAKIKNPSEIMLSWTIDTLNVKGYRVYNSKDGVNWSMIQNEAVVTKQSTTIPVQNSTGHYRVSAVLNTTGFPESNWSNVLSVGNVPGVSRVLIVDGFDREIGDWRGAGNPFVYRYAKT
ncbi:MAG: hypothetical protein HYV28_03780, partial [Ignavibacteriales bacterium]|nr:hypothetical protein [Ignavibacteriales bacterium]